MASCCDRQDWVGVADFGHAGGFDFDLGRCRSCGAYLMAVGYADHPTLNPITDAEAERFLALQQTGGLSAALKRWVD